MRYGSQVLAVLKNLHSIGYLHRDVKPQNIMLDQNEKAHLIDYGIAMPFRTPKGDHVPKVKTSFNEGTFSFYSQNQTRGYVPSRRDDIESLLYTMLFLLKN